MQVEKIPNLKKQKRKALTRSRVPMTEEDEYVLVCIDCAGNKLLILLKRTDTVDTLHKRVITAFKQRLAKKKESTFRDDLFLTIDFDGKKSIGRKEETISNVLQDGQIVYLAFILEETDSSNTPRWSPAKIKYANNETNCRICSAPRKEFKSLQVYSGFSVYILCMHCILDSLHHESSPFAPKHKRNIPSFICTDCGSAGAGLLIDNDMKILRATCLGEECLKDATQKVCAHCGIPMEDIKLQQCERCSLK